MLHFRLYNGPRCQAATCRLLRSTSPPRTTSLSEMLVLSGPRGSCSKARALVLPRVSAHCAQAQHHREHNPRSPSGQSGEPTARSRQRARAACWPTGPQPCHACSVLPRDLPTASQKSTGAYTERLTATWRHVLCGGHWLPPSRAASSSSARWLSCWLRQLYCCSCCAHCWLNPWWARLELRGWKETRGAIGNADTFILPWLAQRPWQQTHYTLSSRG
uniref:Uncharacterized protein n=1 Tax=Rangifer tarandus platyrhynchus TaxID=3082113 RepID=A0ACB0DTI1_RANTA|nr:unnamed protein product [Rangifer tarandus platyrhynchus]